MQPDDIQKLFSMLAEKQISAQDRLYQSIEGENEAEFKALLNHPDVHLDQHMGRALRMAADRQHYHFIRDLILNGADVYHAIQSAVRIENDAQLQDFTPVSYGSSVRYNLNNYQTYFTANIIPVEQVRRQIAIEEKQAQLIADVKEIKDELQRMSDVNQMAFKPSGSGLSS